jgi:hypothetical protein
MSCLFNSLELCSKDITNGDNSSIIRQRICDFLITNPILFDNIDAKTTIEWESNMSLEAYVKSMRNTSTWGGSIEIRCFCQIYNCNVEVYNIRDNNKITMINKNILFQCSNDDLGKIARISWNGGHYEPL